MPDFYFEYDAADGLLAIRVTGAFTDTVMRALYDALVDEIPRHDVRATVLDLSRSREVNLSSAAVRAVSQLPAPLPDPAPKFIVAPHDHIFGMARMFQITSRGRDALQVVRTSQEVYSSLGLTTPAFERLDTR